MNKTLMVLMACLTLSFSGFSAPKANPAQTQLTGQSAAALESHFSIAPGVANIEGNTGLRMAAEISQPIYSPYPVFFSMEVSYAHWDWSGENTVNMFQILPGLVYRFNEKKDAFLRPYLGIVAGLSFSSGEGHGLSTLGLRSSGDNTDITFLFRPGVQFGRLNSKMSWALECKFGPVGPSFAFMPQAAFVLAL